MSNCLQMCLNTIKIVMITAKILHDYCLSQLLLVVKIARYRLLAKKISWLIGKTG